METITLDLTKATATATMTGWVDTLGGTHAGVPAGYSNTSWAADDNGSLVRLTPNGMNNNCRLDFVGPAGNFNLTASCTKSGSATLTETKNIVLQGPQPAGLTVTVA